MSTPKVRYVLGQGQTRDHRCHWPGCERQVPPARWGCRPHWYRLPKAIRDRIWRAFKPGQERSGLPSRAYVEAARDAQRWIAEQEAAREQRSRKALVSRPMFRPSSAGSRR